MGLGSSRQALSKQDIDEIRRQTHLTKEELLSFYDRFMTQNPTGTLDREHYLAMAVGANDPESSYLFERIFDTWDRNGDGEVLFREYIVCMAIMMVGTVEEKLRYTYSIFDVEGTGALRTKQVTDVMRAALAVRDGIEFSPEKKVGSSLEERVKRFMEAADLNHDGVITFEEFEEACKRDPELLVELGADLYDRSPSAQVTPLGTSPAISPADTQRALLKPL